MSRTATCWTRWSWRVAPAAALGFAACQVPSDTERMEALTIEARMILSTAIVSDPVPATAGVSGGVAPGAAEIAYVSLPPGTIPSAEWASIRNRRTGGVVGAAMQDGGLDPVPVTGSAGDTLDLDIRVSSGEQPLLYVLIVPARRPPIVVRTYPPPRKRDVPLNASMLIVFSEPIDPATVTETAVQLLDGQTAVAGLLYPATQLTVSFVPDTVLREATDYVLIITQEIRDLDAEPLEAPVEVPFTTTGTESATSVEILLNPPSAVIEVGNSMLFITMVRDYSNSCVTARTRLEVFPAVTWSVSDATIAVVNESGVVTGLKAGETTVAASCPVGVGRGYGTAVLTVVEREGSVLVTDDYVWSFPLEGRGLALVNHVWGSSATDVFAVGSSELWECCGTIMHYDGTGWGYMSVPDGVFELKGVWGSSPTDVFAVGAALPGGGVILHYDGVVWSTMLTTADALLEAVWGTSATDVFAVGSHGIILHYNGSRWTTVRDATGVEDWLLDIWGTSDGNLFAVGNDVLHSSGGVWSKMRTPPVDWLMGVWGSSSSDVFAVGQAGAIIHYDGVAWSRMDAPEMDGDLLGIWGNSGQDVIAVGSRNWWGPDGRGSPLLHYDGTSWRVLAGMTALPINGVWTTPGRAFIVGVGPKIIEGTRRRDQ